MIKFLLLIFIIVTYLVNHQVGVLTLNKQINTKIEKHLKY